MSTYPQSLPMRYAGEAAASPHFRMRRFYTHLRMHPSYYANAASVAKRLVAKDPSAETAVKDLLAKAGSGSLPAINALKAIGVVIHFEHMLPPGSKTGPYGVPMVSGGLLPAASSAVGKLLRFALSPVAWALNVAGSAAHWAGAQSQNLSRAL